MQRLVVPAVTRRPRVPTPLLALTPVECKTLPFDSRVKLRQSDESGFEPLRAGKSLPTYGLPATARPGSRRLRSPNLSVGVCYRAIGQDRGPIVIWGA
jgi:hypothetical protein